MIFAGALDSSQDPFFYLHLFLQLFFLQLSVYFPIFRIALLVFSKVMLHFYFPVIFFCSKKLNKTSLILFFSDDFKAIY
jgi:hypothetical protein